MAAAQMRTAREHRAAAPLRMAETMKKLVESGVWGEEATADIEDMTPFPIDEWPENEMAPAIDVPRAVVSQLRPVPIQH